MLKHQLPQFNNVTKNDNFFVHVDVVLRVESTVCLLESTGYTWTIQTLVLSTSVRSGPAFWVFVTINRPDYVRGHTRSLRQQC